MSYAQFLSKAEGQTAVKPHVADASDTCNILFSSGTTGDQLLPRCPSRHNGAMLVIQFDSTSLPAQSATKHVLAQDICNLLPDLSVCPTGPVLSSFTLLFSLFFLPSSSQGGLCSVQYSQTTDCGRPPAQVSQRQFPGRTPLPYAAQQTRSSTKM